MKVVLATEKTIRWLATDFSYLLCTVRSLFFLAIWWLPEIAIGQNAFNDSLKAALREPGLDHPDRIELLNDLAYRVRLSFPEEAKAYAREALQLSISTRYPNGECDAHINLGLIDWVESLYDRGMEHGLRALAIAESNEYKKGTMNACLLIASVYLDTDITKAGSYIQRARAIGMELQHREAVARTYNASGNLFRRQGHEEEALKEYQTGLQYLEGVENICCADYTLLNNVALYYIRKTDRSEILKAKVYLDKSLQLTQNSGSKGAEILTRMRTGQFFKKLGQFELAEEQLTTAEKLSIELGFKFRLLDIYTALVEITSHTHRYQEAQQYTMKLMQVKDSIYNIQKAQQLADLVTRNETEKKEQTIRLLQRDKQIQTLWRNALIVILLLTAVAAYIIYRLQRSRTTKAKQLLTMEHQLNDKLSEIDKLRSSFFASISHEFRTPLTLIMAPIEEELKHRTSGREKESLQLVKRNAARLLELVNQLLDLSRLEAGKTQLRIRSGDVFTFLQVITASFETLAHQKRIHFIRHIPGSTLGTWFDHDKLEKIVVNLLANAFKFTPLQGTVTFSVALKSDSTLPGIQITVSDSGEGIPIEEQEKVFLPFYQVGQPGSHTQGTGIGLSLVKELTKLYGGSITLESIAGKGTAFVVTLPVSKDAFAPEQLVPDEENKISPTRQGEITGSLMDVIHDDNQESITGGRDTVLVVEDNTDLRHYIANVLGQHYDVYTAQDGEEAYQTAIQTVPSLVLSDLMMPRMDGMQLTAKIKSDERTSHIPVVLLTAKDELNARIAGLKTGADDYIAKPFSTEELAVRIANLISQRKKLAERFRERIMASTSQTTELSLDEKFLMKVRECVEENMGDYQFTVEKLAEEVNLSRTQLLRKLKAISGLSPNEFIKDVRLTRAAEMIRHRVDTITQIGYAVGFNDQSYFTKCFKKRFSKTPSEFYEQAEAQSVL